MLEMVKPLDVKCPVCETMSVFLWEQKIESWGYYAANCIGCNATTNEFCYGQHPRSRNRPELRIKPENAVLNLENHLIHVAVNTRKLVVDCIMKQTGEVSATTVNLSDFLGINLGIIEPTSTLLKVYFVNPLPTEVAVGLQMWMLLNEAGKNSISILNHYRPEIAEQFRKPLQSVVVIPLSNICCVQI